MIINKKVISIKDVKSEEQPRIATGLIRLDDFLNGGFVQGQCILLGADPGAGKSTSTTQIATRFCDLGYTVLYFSGEESLGQIKLRADRLGANRANFFCTEILELNEMKDIIEQVNPKLIIVDSMPMMFDNTVEGTTGSDKQIKESMLKFTKYIKKTNRITIVIGHANKGGALAGLLKLQHMVDSTFYIKVFNHMRTLTIIKNRFGPDSNELPLTMSKQGFRELQIGVKSIQVEQEKSLPAHIIKMLVGLG